MREDPLASLHQHGLLCPPPHQLQRKVGLYRKRDVRRAAGIDSPPAIRILVSQNLINGALHLPAVARAEQRVHEDIVGLQHRVGFQFAAPVAIGMLQSQQPVRTATDRIGNAREAYVHASITRLHRRRLRIPSKCTHQIGNSLLPQERSATFTPVMDS